MLQAVLETRLTVPQSDILHQGYRSLSVSKGIFIVKFINIYVYQLPEYSVHEKSFSFTPMWQTAIPHTSAQTQTDCFVKSQLFSVIYTGCLKNRFHLRNTGYLRKIHMISSFNHHLIVPPARISLTLSRHPSLSFIASGRSSRLHPVSSQSCCM